jgi:hypothetical protein
MAQSNIFVISRARARLAFDLMKASKSATFSSIVSIVGSFLIWQSPRLCFHSTMIACEDESFSEKTDFHLHANCSARLSSHDIQFHALFRLQVLFCSLCFELMYCWSKLVCLPARSDTREYRIAFRAEPNPRG